MHSPVKRMLACAIVALLLAQGAVKRDIAAGKHEP